jgi:phospholipid/cholesterol/gamma-HCH transport system substrate-binding protein
MLGIAALVFLALKSANLLTLNFQRGYQLTARFDNIGGLKPQAAVRSAGVVVGRVESIAFDDKTYQARVTLAMQVAKPVRGAARAELLASSPMTSLAERQPEQAE